MILFKNKQNTKIFLFNNIIFSLFLVLFTNIILNNNYIVTNQNNSLNQYMLTLTYYYPGDATGSGSTTGSGVTTSNLTTDEKGWYHYQKDGVNYLVVAAATTYCRDSSNHCGVNIQKHGIAKTIHYYKYFDTLKIDIGGKTYDAIVLDSCGACMWGDRDIRGEKIDVFVRNSSSVKPGIYDSSISSGVTENNGNAFINFTTNYSGDVTKGYIYERQTGKGLKETTADKIDDRINSIISSIFGSSNYSSSSGSGGDVSIGSFDSNALNWKQYDSAWGSIHLGSSKHTIKSAGCLATSVAIQIKISGTTLNVNNFNPGLFVGEISKNNGFTSGGLFIWNGSWKTMAPNWNYYGKDSLPATKSGKIDYIRNLLNQGYYPVMCVKRDCGHWVAVTGVSEDNIIIADPGSNSTSVWPRYNAISNDSTLKVAYFKG
mgnify:FL=1